MGQGDGQAAQGGLWSRMGWGGGWRHRRRQRGSAGDGGGHCGGEPWIGLSLNDLQPGTSARVWRLHGQGGIRQRLLDLGLLPGVDVMVVRSAPLDDPIEIRIGDAFLSLRRAEAMMIEMRHV